jgi:hypothetical protein
MSTTQSGQKDSTLAFNLFMGVIIASAVIGTAYLLYLILS